MPGRPTSLDRSAASCLGHAALPSLVLSTGYIRRLGCSTSSAGLVLLKRTYTSPFLRRRHTVNSDHNITIYFERMRNAPFDCRRRRRLSSAPVGVKHPPALTAAFSRCWGTRRMSTPHPLHLLSAGVHVDSLRDRTKLSQRRRAHTFEEGGCNVPGVRLPDHVRRRDLQDGTLSGRISRWVCQEWVRMRDVIVSA